MAGSPPGLSGCARPRPSVLQQVHVVDRGRASGSEDGHDDRQPHDDLGGRDDHHEEGHHLPGQVTVDAART